MEEDLLLWENCPISEHRGGLEHLWIETWTGIRFYPFHSPPGPFKLEDIARGLSLACRFAGHIADHYSVAQHSVLVMIGLSIQDPNVSPEVKLAGLLHDASEAYLGDLPAPIKVGLPDYQRLESNFQEEISRTFGAPYPWPSIVDEVDQRMLLTEGLAFGKNVKEWGLPADLRPMEGITIAPWGSGDAERAFYAVARDLMATIESSKKRRI